MKYFLLVLLVFALFLPANLQTQVKTEPTIVYEPPREYDFGQNAIHWYGLDSQTQMHYALRMMQISDGALMFNVKSSDKIEAIEEAGEILTKVIECMDSDIPGYMEEFQADIDIGSILIQCMIKNRMHD